MAAPVASGPVAGNSRARAAAALALVAIAALAATTGQAIGETPAREAFGAQRDASPMPPSPIGKHARGCLAGAAQLPESGPTWQAMRLSRNRNWGHPETIEFIRDLSEFAASLPGWQGLYVGDISQPRGGPMLTGHRSHQSGLDVDIWMLPPSRLDLAEEERETLNSISLRRAGGAYVNGFWTPEHHRLIREAAMDPRVARIFVFPGAKTRMCQDETASGSGRNWLQKVRPWWGHHYHFHVRLSCPPDAPDCVDQRPPNEGDGCAEAETWVRDILDPPERAASAAPASPRPEIVLADLPRSCAAVLE